MKKEYVQRPTVYLGAQILTHPGIYVPSTQSPSGGVSRVPNVKIAGKRRMVSLMTPFRCGSLDNATGSWLSTVSSSRYICSAWDGYRARK